MIGFRGGYKSFYAAVQTLTSRGVFDAAEVNVRPGAAMSKSDVGAGDEYIIPFPDGMYTTCTYRRLPTGELVIADDSEAGLHVEQFVVNPGQYAPFDVSGICKLELRHGGKYAKVYTGNPRHGQHFTATVTRAGGNQRGNNGINRQSLRTFTSAQGTQTGGGPAVDNGRLPRRYKISKQYQTS